MLGFEVTLNGRSITAAIKKGVLTVILTNRNMHDRDEISLNVAGLNLEAGTDTTWLKQEEIKEGDEIIIKIKKVEQVTAPANKKDLDKEIMQKERIQSYYNLKSSLEKDGLI
jgi:hypothetical protein